VKSTNQLRGEADRLERRAHEALSRYISDTVSFDHLEDAITEAFVAQRNLAAAESLDHAQRTLGPVPVAKLAKMCGVHLGPDLTPDTQGRVL
jgi:hypothetical protein